MGSPLTRNKLSLFLGLAAILFFPSTARADEQDPPTRVARISYLHGSVSFQPGGAGEWGAATRNRPMTVGDRIWTDYDSRAELQAGAASVRLNARTALSFLNLDDRIIQMRVAEGEVNFRVRELRGEDLYEVDTPNLTFTVIRAGAFRLDVSEGGNFTGITVIRGEGEVTASGHTYKIREGERGEFRGSERIGYDIHRAPGLDKFDRWSNDRDLRADRSVSSRYVSRDVIGYDDLDDYGTWRDVSGYGPVWYPSTVYAGWAPYRYGNWSWIGPWGWTWVDYSPWGFAPYHYGRWAYINGYWGWCPGPVYVRPIYAPALVAFVGGHHWGVAFGFGEPVAWFPLGYGEPYYPWYHSSRVYITNINITNTYIRNVNVINQNENRDVNFVNARNVDAVTAVSERAFAGGEAVNRAAVRVTPELLRDAQVSTRAEVTPTERSILGASTGERVATPPASVESRPVFTRNAPSPAAGNLPVRSAPEDHQSGDNSSSPRQRDATGDRAPHSRDLEQSPSGSPRQRDSGIDRFADRPTDRSGDRQIERSEHNDRPPAASRPIPERDNSTPATRENARPPSEQPREPRATDRPGDRRDRPSEDGNSTAERPPRSRDRESNDGSQRESTRPSAPTPRSDRPSEDGNSTGERPPRSRARESDDGSQRESSRPSAPAPRSDRPSEDGNLTGDRPPQSRDRESGDGSQRESSRPSSPPEDRASRPAPSFERGSRGEDSPRNSAPRSYSPPPQRSDSPPPRGESSPRGSSGPSGQGSSGNSPRVSPRGRD